MASNITSSRSGQVFPFLLLRTGDAIARERHGLQTPPRNVFTAALADAVIVALNTLQRVGDLFEDVAFAF